jgi:hypothetical protein
MSLITNLFKYSHYNALKINTEKRIDIVLKYHNNKRDIKSVILQIIIDNFVLIESLDIFFNGSLKYSVNKRSLSVYCEELSGKDNVYYSYYNITDNYRVKIVAYDCDNLYNDTFTDLIKKYIID